MRKHIKSVDDDPGDCTDYSLDDALSQMLDEDFPQDKWFDELDRQETLQYKDEVVVKLIDALQDYLSFSTTKDLLRLIVEHT